MGIMFIDLTIIKICWWKMDKLMKFAARVNGATSAKDNMQRVVPKAYQKYSDEWKAGYDEYIQSKKRQDV